MVLQGSADNPTNAVGGSFILSLQRSLRTHLRKSHQRSWWIVHTQPQKKPKHAPPQIPPTQLVDRSYSAYKEAYAPASPNPTNAVGGSFILGLQRSLRTRLAKSH